MKVELLRFTPDAERAISEDAAICYDSKGANVKRLKANSHFATFRFAHATFEFSEFSRTCSMQMLRHAFLDFLQRSQRYVKEFQFEYVTPPSVAENPLANMEYHYIMKECANAYEKLLNWGIKAEDARYLLPNATHTKMRVVGNFQAWYDFLYGDAGRLQKAAQWEIKEVAQEVQRQLAEIAPHIFGSIKWKDM